MSLAKSGAAGIDEFVSSDKAIKPERNLLAAVLSRAICDAFGDAQVDRHVARSARQWLFGMLTPSKAFSFAWVAIHLDFDPKTLQQVMKQLDSDPVMAQERLGLLR